MRSAQWAPSTRETNLCHLNLHILPRLGTQVLCEVEKFHCQVFVNKLAEDDFSFTIVDHCRTMLKAVFEEALDADLVGKNPARKLYNPERRESEKFVLPKLEACTLLEALPFRDRLVAGSRRSAPCAPGRYSASLVIMARKSVPNRRNRRSPQTPRGTAMLKTYKPICGTVTFQPRSESIHSR
jgi:Phage integrase, N-terminal SAM-like domain